MTLPERVDAYADSLGRRFPDSIPWVSRSGRWLNGVWLLGNAYRGSGYYGAYPPGYLPRIAALFPDVPMGRWLHLFSGSLAPTVAGLRVDIRGAGIVPPTVRASATALPFIDGAFSFIAADPPYTTADAKHYGTGSLNKRHVLHEAARSRSLGARSSGWTPNCQCIPSVTGGIGATSACSGRRTTALASVASFRGSSHGLCMFSAV